MAGITQWNRNGVIDASVEFVFQGTSDRLQACSASLCNVAEQNAARQERRLEQKLQKFYGRGVVRAAASGEFRTCDTKIN